jgi:nitroreductase
MAAQNIMVRAHDLKLAGCVVRSFNQEAVRELLGAPDHIQPELLINIGYPDRIPPKPNRRQDVVFWEQFGNGERGDHL